MTDSVLGRGKKNRVDLEHSFVVRKQVLFYSVKDSAERPEAMFTGFPQKL